MRAVGARNVCKEDGSVNDWRSWRGLRNVGVFGRGGHDPE